MPTPRTSVRKRAASRSNPENHARSRDERCACYMPALSCGAPSTLLRQAPYCATSTLPRQLPAPYCDSSQHLTAIAPSTLLRQLQAPYCDSSKHPTATVPSSLLRQFQAPYCDSSKLPTATAPSTLYNFLV